jgi:transposase
VRIRIETDLDAETGESRIAARRRASQRLLSIPAVRTSTAATLMAEIGGIWRFTDVDQLLAYAGVHPTGAELRGRRAHPETSWTMAKTGTAYPRAAAYRMAVVGVQHNPILRAHYARKRAAGKSTMNALGHCTSKALAIVCGVGVAARTSIRRMAVPD